MMLGRGMRWFRGKRAYLSDHDAQNRPNLSLLISSSPTKILRLEEGFDYIHPPTNLTADEKMWRKKKV